MFNVCLCDHFQSEPIEVHQSVVREFWDI